MTLRSMSRPGRSILAVLLFAILGALLALLLYAAMGYVDALRDAPRLKARADRLIAEGHGPDALTPAELRQLIRVEDPDFWHHHGVDNNTPGAGVTTITQSLSKQLAFAAFKPGLRKIRQTTYAKGLEARLSKRQILALFLAEAPFGRGPKGWMQGVFTASAQVYGKSPAELTQAQWLRLVAVLVTPSDFHLFGPDPRLDERVRRIGRLVAGMCQPRGNGDVMLDGCA